MINLDTNTLSVRMSSKSYEYFSDIYKFAFYVDFPVQATRKRMDWKWARI